MSADITALKRQLGHRIFALRKAAGMTQFELAEAAGVGNEYISKIERGAGSPSLETLAKSAKALQVELKDLFDLPTERQPSLPERRSLKVINALKALSPQDIQLLYDLARRLARR
jgi:transcriptional regulator with XRE-family HTH domain